MATADTVPITAQCLCKAHTFTTLVPRTKLPLQAWCCHCDSCRHATGALYACVTPWLGPTGEVRNANMRRYVFTSKFTILSCGTCSTPMFFHGQTEGGEDTLTVMTGTLNNDSAPNLIKIVDHIFVGDTIDGGASMWLRRPNEDGSVPRRWRAGKDTSEELDYNWPGTKSLLDARDKSGPDEIPLRCHCKGVNLVLRRGDADFAAMKQNELPWFVEPTSHKLLTSFDACNSCRSTLGVDVINWAFALLQHIGFPASDSVDQPSFPQTTTDLKAAISSQKRDPRLGTLAMYESSPGVQRYFCSRCSASVFYAVDDRQELVDVAIGLLASPSGARAEPFLAWAFGSDVNARDDVVGGWRENLVKSIQKEAEAWRIERGYPKSWKRIAKEEAERVS
ncbi:hypothetical protein AK830_g7537 [Neonectria ditissima]|uniref:CENP-V/GFA domain-containing protein n=1 Tax=Neonectria ditissima TaxID=78410 RepID=A0A0P7AMK6_9HYPO|nr:hypothetical protein AK830_g7537 [Neonectria ditissima]